MKKNLTYLIMLFFLSSFSVVHAQTEIDTTDVKSVASNKEEKNRNVMLNAGSNTGPRDVNYWIAFSRRYSHFRK